MPFSFRPAVAAAGGVKGISRGKKGVGRDQDSEGKEKNKMPGTGEGENASSSPGILFLLFVKEKIISHP